MSGVEAVGDEAVEAAALVALPIGSVVTYRGGAAHHEYVGADPGWQTTNGMFYGDSFVELMVHRLGPIHLTAALPALTAEWGPDLLTPEGQAEWREHQRVLTEEEADRTIPFDCQRTSDCPCPPNAERIGCYAPPDDVAALTAEVERLRDSYDSAVVMRERVIRRLDEVYAELDAARAEVERVEAEFEDTDGWFYDENDEAMVRVAALRAALDGAAADPAAATGEGEAL